MSKMIKNMKNDNVGKICLEMEKEYGKNLIKNGRGIENISF